MYNYRFIVSEKKKIQEKFEELIPVYLKVVFEVFSFVHFILFCHKCKQTFLRKEEKIIDFYLLYFRPSLYSFLCGGKTV